MNQEDAYFARRAAEQRERAAGARSEESRRLHLELADLLAARAREMDDPAARP
jgi:hypothetical protein